MKFFTYVMMFVGIVFIFVGCLMFWSNYKKTRVCTEQTVGTVVELEKRTYRTTTRNRKYSTTWCPVVEYYVGEQLVRCVSATGQNPPKYEIGESVNIKYNPENVEEYIIDGDGAMSIVGVVFTCVGVIFLGVTLFVFIKIKR